MSKNHLRKNNENNDELSVEEIHEINDTELHKYSKSAFIENMYTFIITITKLLLNSIVMLLKVSGIYLLWICLHYFSAHLYIKCCVPNTIIGFIMSPIMISTPHCQGLRWIIYNASGIINNMWLVIGAWVYSIIWIAGTEYHNK